MSPGEKRRRPELEARGDGTTGGTVDTEHTRSGMAVRVDTTGWTDEEVALLGRHLAGETVVVSRRRRRHARLIAWATAAGVYTYIGRPSPWGNPFEIGPDGDRAEVIAKHRADLLADPHRLADVAGLRGRVLGCWCAPSPCHGDTLARLADEADR